MSRRFGRQPVRASDQLQREQPRRGNEPGYVSFQVGPGQAPYRLPLSTIVPDPTDELVLHVIGDSGGIVDAAPQEAVCAALVADLDDQPVGLITDGDPPPAPRRPSLLYHVGDLVYFNGDADQWFPQFYEPNEAYDAPIVGVPGNHDGDNSDAPFSSASLAAFIANMCSPVPQLTPQAGDVDRDAMTQPNPYWTLTSNLATIVGLYSNVPSGGVIDADQADWLVDELRSAPGGRALIVALHHPPYSCDAHHGGSAAMGEVLDDAFEAAGRWPTLVVSGHVHNYQRLLRQVGSSSGAYGQQVPYVVCGAGGYHNLHQMAQGIGQLPWPAGGGVTLEAFCDSQWGFLRLTVTPTQVTGEYHAVTPGTPGSTVVDRFTAPV